jgi:hypothetical protein
MCTLTPRDTMEAHNTLAKSRALSPSSSAPFAILLTCSNCDNITGGNVLLTFEIAGLADNFRYTLK